jgi:MEDS: MEthanogen/methylotroph, DcmR Sensory domain
MTFDPSRVRLHAPEHFVQFYRSDFDVMERVARRAATALRNGSASVIVATPEHRTRIEARLATLGVDLDSARASGMHVALDAAETLARFIVDGMPDDVTFNAVIGDIVSGAAARSAGGHVSVFGEMVALLCASDDAPAAVRLERMWNELAARFSFSLFCAYPLELFAHDFDGNTLLAVCAEHDLSIPAENTW